ncbi:MAG: type III pantothenate kinase [Bifidobacteriaceae bacterium]|nr:type III pantothenate kinase [Bifidobacteriaceae bacterium]
MLLAIDIGNTHIVFGFIKNNNIVATYRLSTFGNKTSDEYGVSLLQFIQLSGCTAKNIEDVIITSVVPQILHILRDSIKKYLHINPLVVAPGVKTGIGIHIDDPKSLGADCLADCAGAYYEYGGNTLVADFGTATTFNFVNDQGTIINGLIAPGIHTSAASLWTNTAQLPEVEITKPNTIMATNTQTAMQAGLFYNAIGGIEKIIQQFKLEIPQDFQVIATGGLGRLVAQESSCIDVYDENLIFKGMLAIYNKNRARS